MRHFPAVILVLLLCAAQGAHAQKQNVDTVDASQYFVVHNDPKVIWVYRLGELAFLDVFSQAMQPINGADYFVRIRKYSTGAYDTAYYRAKADGFYRGIPLPNGGLRESLVLPRRVFTGQRWLEGDSSWSYQITSTNSSLTTPVARYKGLIEITTTPVNAADKNAKANRMYFAQGIGLVAYTVEGKIAAYLRTMQKVTGTQSAMEIDPK